MKQWSTNNMDGLTSAWYAEYILNVTHASLTKRDTCEIAYSPPMKSNGRSVFVPLVMPQGRMWTLLLCFSQDLLWPENRESTWRTSWQYAAYIKAHWCRAERNCHKCLSMYFWLRKTKVVVCWLHFQLFNMLRRSVTVAKKDFNFTSMVWRYGCKSGFSCIAVRV